MTRTKKTRPTVASPDPGDERATLHLVYARADYLRDRWIEASKDGHDAIGLEQASAIESGYGSPIWVYVTLHLASLHTVVEGWRRLSLSDSAIDSALSDTVRLDQLRSLRDGVFHFGAVNNPAIMNVLTDRAMLDWARTLHHSFGSYFASPTGAA